MNGKISIIPPNYYEELETKTVLGSPGFPEFEDFFVENMHEGCGITLVSKKEFEFGDKLMDLKGNLTTEIRETVKIYEKCLKKPTLFRRKFFIQTITSFYCMDMERSAYTPCFYLLQRRTDGYNCRAEIYYDEKDIKQIFPKIAIVATRYIPIGEPIIVYYGLLWPLCSSRHLLSPLNNGRLLNYSNLYTSSPINYRKKAKFIDPVVIGKTKSKKKGVDIYEDTSLIEFCRAGELNFDEVSDKIIELNEKYIKYVDDSIPLDKNVILDLASCFGIKPRFVKRTTKVKTNLEEEDIFPQPLPDPSICEKRPPVVTIMGHVDHGKTTLLDALRSSRIVDSEHGGITQHIGAFSVKLKNSNSTITFLDTPGHSAFKGMRKRGAQATDIVVLVVAADDGVKEQTIESIKYAKEADVPIVVAINKCDKPNADVNLARRSLMEHDVVVEDMGGDVQVVEISALHKKNIDTLQEELATLADLLDLKSTRKGLAEGIVIESSSVQGLGKVCTLIVQRGTLKRGSVIVCGKSWGKVRSMTDEFGKIIKEAGPSTPVRIAGWRGDYTPSPGDIVLEVEKEDRAQKVVNFREKQEMNLFSEKEYKNIDEKRKEEREIYLQNRQILLNKGIRYSSTLRRVVHKKEQLRKEVEDDSPKLNLILRSDVDGTLEAILNVIDSYKSKKCELNLVDFGVGPPIENHIELAIETKSLVYCFNTPVSVAIKEMALKGNVKLEQFLIIYRLIESLKKELNEKLPKVREYKHVGEGHVLKEFLISDRGKKKQPIAGALVDWGVFEKNKLFRFSRGSNTIFEGYVESLKCGNEFVNQVKTNCEVGILLTNKNIRFKEDDTIEVLDEIEIPQEIDWYPPGF